MPCSQIARQISTCARTITSVLLCTSYTAKAFKEASAELSPSIQTPAGLLQSSARAALTQTVACHIYRALYDTAYKICEQLCPGVNGEPQLLFCNDNTKDLHLSRS